MTAPGPIAFLDTNVLFGAISTDMFLTLAEKDDVMFVPRWSDYVCDELREHLGERIRVPEGCPDPNAYVVSRVEARIDAMNRAFPHALTSKWRTIVPHVKTYVRDPDDVQILAGAVASHADYLVTCNVSDFDVDGIRRMLGISVNRPGRFLSMLFETNNDMFISNMRAMVDSNRRFPHTLEELHRALSESPEYRGIAGLIEDYAVKRYRRHAPLRPSYRSAQPRDSKGRFTFIPIRVGDEDLDTCGNSFWGADGNGF